MKLAVTKEVSKRSEDIKSLHSQWHHGLIDRPTNNIATQMTNQVNNQS